MAKLPQLTAQDITGITVFPPTPVIPGRNTWQNREAVDYDEAARTADYLIDQGAALLAYCGTYGEVSGMTIEERKKMHAAVVETVKGRVPVFAGATRTNTRDAIELAQFYRDIGAEGLLLGLPIIPKMSPAAIIGYYKDVIEAVPEMNIMIYDDPDQFKGPIPTSVYAELAKLPQVVASKYRDRSELSSLKTNTLIHDLRAVNGGIKLLPFEGDYYYHARMFDVPERDAFWSCGLCCAPAVVTTLRDAVDREDWATALEASDDIGHAYSLLFPKGQPEDFPFVKIPSLKGMVDEAGLVKAGPCLPPYHVLPEGFDVLGTAQEVGRRWRALQQKWG